MKIDAIRKVLDAFLTVAEEQGCLNVSLHPLVCSAFQEVVVTERVPGSVSLRSKYLCEGIEVELRRNWRETTMHIAYEHNEASQGPWEVACFLHNKDEEGVFPLSWGSSLKEALDGLSQSQLPSSSFWDRFISELKRIGDQP